MDYINTQQFLYDAYILGEEVQFQYITLFIVMIMSWFIELKWYI